MGGWTIKKYIYPFINVCNSPSIITEQEWREKYLQRFP